MAITRQPIIFANCRANTDTPPLPCTRTQSPLPIPERVTSEVQAWNCQSEFEWGHHLEYALNAGISRAEVDRIPAGPGADGWSDTDRALLEAADQLHAKQDITDEVWSKLAAQYSDKQLVEILFVVGEYTMLSMVVNASGVELEEGYESLPTMAPAN